MPSTSSSRDVAQFYLPLPVELFREIIIRVSQIIPVTLGTLAALARVSKTFHNLVMPILYHRVHLWTDGDARSLITSIQAAHAASVDNAKYIVLLFFEPDMMECFDDVMSLPGLNPKTLFFETHYGPNNVGQVASSWEARPKCMVLLKYSYLSHKDPWVCQRMALFSHLTHLCLEEILDDDALSFCLELRTLTHISLPVCRDLDSTATLGQIHSLLGMPSMELVLLYAVFTRDDAWIDRNSFKDQLNAMGFPKGGLFPLLAEIPDERLYVCPEMDMYKWYMYGITPWDLRWRHLTMPWRKAVKVQ